jgi:hypothetical protein
MEFLLEDLRVEKDVLRNLQFNEINKWLTDAPKKERIRMLIKTLEKL